MGRLEERLPAFPEMSYQLYLVDKHIDISVLPHCTSVMQQHTSHCPGYAT
jgi:hypothetical protein